MIDLVTVKLTQADDLELVERQQMELIANEFEIVRLYGAEATGNRLKIGERINADALVFLSLEESGKPKLLRIIVSDCRYGARLHDESFLFSADKIADHADQCARIVEDTRTQFADGIKYLFGVSDFLSKNLTHDYDHLQAGFSQLVGNALGSAPGVAVIEVAESRAISAELLRQDDRVKGSIVPLLIGGEFEVSLKDDEPSIKILVRLSDARNVRETFERDGISMQSATELLTLDIPKKVLELSDEKSTKLFSRTELLTKLGKRASAFSQRGAWKQATDLREAALLLDPKDYEQRLELIADYRHWHYDQHLVETKFWDKYVTSYRYFHVYGKKRGETIDNEKEQLAEIYENRLIRIRRITENIEFVCRHKAVNAYEGHLIMAFGYEDLPMNSFPGEEDSPEFQRVVHDFFWSTYPFLPQSSLQVGEQLARQCVVRGSPRFQIATANRSEDVARHVKGVYWVRGAVDYIFLAIPLRHRIDPGDDHRLRVKTEWDDSKTLGELMRFFEEVVPQNFPSDHIIGLTLGDRSGSTLNNMMDMIHQGRFKEEQFRDFFKVLEQSKKPLNQLYARCGKLTLDIYPDPTVRPDSSALQELDDIKQAFDKVVRGAPGIKAFGYNRYFANASRRSPAACNGKDYQTPLSSGEHDSSAGSASATLFRTCRLG